MSITKLALIFLISTVLEVVWWCNGLWLEMQTISIYFKVSNEIEMVHFGHSMSKVFGLFVKYLKHPSINTKWIWMLMENEISFVTGCSSSWMILLKGFDKDGFVWLVVLLNNFYNNVHPFL